MVANALARKVATASQRFAEAEKASMNTCRVAEIVRVNNPPSESPRVDVQPLMRDSEGRTLPEIRDVPLGYFSLGPFSITALPEVGDEVLLLFNQESMDEYLTGVGGANEPEDLRTFALNDAVVVARIRPLPEDFFVSDTLIIKGPSGFISMDQSGNVIIDAPGGVGSEIQLGSTAAVDFVALASLVLAEFTAVKVAYDVHTHASFVAPPVPLLPVPGSVAATKVKAE